MAFCTEGDAKGVSPRSADNTHPRPDGGEKRNLGPMEKSHRCLWRSITSETFPYSLADRDDSPLENGRMMVFRWPSRIVAPITDSDD